MNFKYMITRAAEELFPEKTVPGREWGRNENGSD